MLSSVQFVNYTERSVRLQIELLQFSTIKLHLEYVGNKVSNYSQVEASLPLCERCSVRSICKNSVIGKRTPFHKFPQ